MPQLPFKQKIFANQVGELRFNDTISLPFKATLKELTIKVSSNCSERIHPCCFQLFQNTELIVDLSHEQVVDCVKYIFPRPSLTLGKGEYRANILAGGFHPSEEVSIDGLLVFGFGFSFAKVEGFHEVLIDLEAVIFD